MWELIHQILLLARGLLFIAVCVSFTYFLGAIISLVSFKVFSLRLPLDVFWVGVLALILFFGGLLCLGKITNSSAENVPERD